MHQTKRQSSNARKHLQAMINLDAHTPMPRYKHTLSLPTQHMEEMKCRAFSPIFFKV